MIYWCHDGCAKVYRIMPSGDEWILSPGSIPEAEPEHRLCRSCSSILRSARNGGLDAESLCYD